jgi:hypothetical protein
MWGNGEQLAKPLANGDVAVLLFNRLATPIDIVCEYYLGCVLPPLPRACACAIVYILVVGIHVRVAIVI